MCNGLGQWILVGGQTSSARRVFLLYGLRTTVFWHLRFHVYINLFSLLNWATELLPFTLKKYISRETGHDFFFWRKLDCSLWNFNCQPSSSFHIFLIRHTNETNINGSVTQGLKGSRPNVCSNLLTKLTCASWSLHFRVPTNTAYYCFIAGSSKA